MDLSKIDEKELLTLAREGDCEAFGELVKRDLPLGYAQAMALTDGNHTDAWDIVQTAYLKAWKAIGKFKGDSRFSTWRNRILYHAFLDAQRKAKRKKDFEESSDAGEEDEPTKEYQDLSEGPEDEVVAKSAEEERNMRVHDALKKLNADYRLFLKLVDMRCYGSGLTTTGKKKSKYEIVLRYFRLLVNRPGITHAIPYNEGLDFDGFKRLYEAIQKRNAYDLKLLHARRAFTKFFGEEGPPT